jgi:hypothetical protein
MSYVSVRRLIVLAVLLGSGVATCSLPTQLSQAQTPGKKKRKNDDSPPARPTDPKLIAIHKEFLDKAEKLADEYEKKKQLDKAREVYEAILRLVPKYPRAEEALERLLQTEATTDKKQITIAADKGWQETGVLLQEGKPVIIEAKGKWTFKMSHTLGPEGIEIPKELRDFNLGALVGVIVTGPDPKEFKPFLIGAQKEFTAQESGRLLLRMYDSDPADNSGQVQVTVQSTFIKKQP